MVLEQLAQLVLLAGGHHLKDRHSSLLVQLSEQIGRVVGRHALEDPSRLLVGLRLQELDLVLRVQLFEDVGREPWVALDRLDDLLPFFMRGVLDDVRDLRGVKPAEALQWHQELGGRDLADERLHVFPVEDRVAA